MPERRCIATGETKGPGEMVRFVVGPEGGIVPDLAGDLPGRGIWVSARRDCLELAVRKRLFARAARADVTVPPDLADLVERLVARRALDLLGLARRAGQVVAGFEKVRERLAAGRVAVLVQAGDAAPDGRARARSGAG
ncbi:MAG: RNA-binding protein, partial [Alphaproteobacteria bacterium]|nr:RNA-binding protein [Alphaproteobacteria bacterium]